MARDNNANKSLIASFLLHGAILVMALVVLPNPKEFEVPPQDAIQVDISMIGDVSKRQAQSKSADKPVEKAAPKAAPEVKKVDPAPKVDDKVKTAVKEAAAEPEPPKPPEPKPPEPKPPEPKPPEPPKPEEPKPLDSDPLKKMIEKTDEPKPLNDDPLKEIIKQEAEAQKVAEAKAKADAEAKAKAEAKAVADTKAKADAKAKAEAKAAQAKAEKKKAKNAINDISAFLNKTDDEKTAPQQHSDQSGTPNQGTQDIQGTDDALVATLVDALQSRTKECWTVPPSAREAEFSIKVHFFLNQDGSVNGMPEVVNSSSDPVFMAAAQSAVSAIAGCNYADVLPPDKYDLWKENTLSFKPNMMFGT